MFHKNRTSVMLMHLSFILSLNNCGRLQTWVDAFDYKEGDSCKSNPSKPNCIKTPINQEPQLGAMFTSCAAFQATLNSRDKNPKMAWAQPGPVGSEAQKDTQNIENTATDIGTNLQEKGVDESDTYKISDTHIFVVQGHRLMVLDKSTKAILGSLDHWLGTATELYTVSDSLVIVDAIAASAPRTTQMPASPSGIVPSTESNNRSNQLHIRTRFFKTQSGALPKFVNEYRFSGRRLETRLEKNRLVLVSQDSFYGRDPSKDNAQTQHKGLNCTRILKPQIDDASKILTTLRSIPISGGEISEVSVLGNINLTYMAAGSLFLTQIIYGATVAKLESQGTKIISDKSFPASTQKLTYIQSIRHADNGTWGELSVGTVLGRIKDKWALQQLGTFGEYLAVATTTGYLSGTGVNQSKNHMSVLKREGAKLQLKGSVRDFGLNEDIRSVRYFNNIAYIVTFKKTDPLFAISLANPDFPVILGQLKVPGFSTFMKPLSNNILAGVGYDAVDAGTNSDFALFQGIQLSLFDISNPKTMSRLDNVVLGDRGSQSEATHNSHAFFYDPVAQIISLPVTLLKNTAGENGMRAPESSLAFSGAIFYSVANNKLEELTRISHQSWLPQPCKSQSNSFRWWQNTGGSATFDIARIFKVDDSYLSLSPFGLKSLPSDIKSDVTLEEIEFSPGQVDFMCNRKPLSWCGTP